jgi:WD40 repeat protein
MMINLTIRIYGQRLLISTSFDRKIKIWDSTTGQHLDSLRKGNSDESFPINFKEKKHA